MTPNEIARVCCERGIDWIAITDHNSAGNVRVFTEVLDSGLTASAVTMSAV